MRKFKISILMIAFLLSIVTINSNAKIAKAVDPMSITRGQAEERALKMINLTWTYSREKNVNIDSKHSSYVTKPSQLKNSTGGAMQGIPYNWGGLDGLDSSSYSAPWSNFLSAVNKGAYIGNVNTDAGYGYIPGTAGIDCSGFVQATFNINDYKLSTSTIFNKYFTKIDLNSIKHMDILNKVGEHIVIFDKWGTQNGVYGAFTYESTPDTTYGGIQGTKKYFMSMKELNSGYIAGRYVNITEENTTTQPAPIKPGVFVKVYNINSSANVRMSPSASSSIIATIPNNTIIYLIDYSSGWYQISFNGKVGFISQSLIASIESGKYVTVKSVSMLNVRSNPSTNSSIVGTISTNQYGEVLDYSSDGKWIKIRVNGIEGWSSKIYLSYIY